MAKRTNPLSAPELTSLGISKSFASELLSGRKLPSLRMAFRIQDATGWPANRWLEMESQKKEAAR